MILYVVNSFFFCSLHSCINFLHLNFHCFVIVKRIISIPSIRSHSFSSSIIGTFRQILPYISLRISNIFALIESFMLLFSLINQILINVPFILLSFFHSGSSFFFKGFGLAAQILGYLSSSILCQSIFFVFLSYFEIEIGETFFYLFSFFLILFGLFSHQFFLMFKVIFNIPFLILNYFVPASSLLFLLVKHHLVGATSTSSLESLPLH